MQNVRDKKNAVNLVYLVYPRLCIRRQRFPEGGCRGVGQQRRRRIYQPEASPGLLVEACPCYHRLRSSRQTLCKGAGAGSYTSKQKVVDECRVAGHRSWTASSRISALPLSASHALSYKSLAVVQTLLESSAVQPKRT